MSDIVAIRSLQCPDHAHNIPPKVLTVQWNITKRCNYDCSYCSPFIHDAVSPFVNVDHVNTLLKSCHEWCGQDRQIKWAITGGEPFIDPNIIDTLKKLRDQPFTHQINITTNGSLPAQIYLNAAKFVDGITFSLHFERSDSEIAKTINTITQVAGQADILVSVNIMFLPGNSDKIQKIIALFKENKISYVVRLITPNDAEAIELKPYTDNGNGKKGVKLKSAKEQRLGRQQFQIENLIRADDNIQTYYSNSELELIKKLNDEPLWQNVGIWLKNSTYEEVNTDQLVSTSRINFIDWICYAGVDSIYIDWDGTIYRGLCLNDGPIGHISNTTFINSPSEPTICQENRCKCNVDIAVRKTVSAKYLKLVS
jgi:molybdenum cofactor biosynthesis enzyme MoaA